MSAVVFDLAIIGAGASGLQLLYEYIQADPFKEKKILLLDSGDRSQKSWCFWEDEKKVCFPFLVEKSWHSMTYTTSSGDTLLSPINPLQYHYISSERFFQYFFNEFIPGESNITHLKQRAKDIHEGENIQTIICEDGTEYQATKIADSRPAPSKGSIFQHFSGKFIEFEEPILDDSTMTLMDFSLPASTTDMAVFHYILPFSKTKALIETTVFTKLAYDKEAYESIWQKYIDAQFNSKKFKILSNETGTIPMGAQIRKKEGNVFQIGAAGGNMKASTGYAFTRMLEDAKNRAQNRLKMTPARFRFYDKMLLKIMNNDMAKIPQVMDRLFTRVPKKDILSFLDDKTTLLQEVKLLAQLDIPLFIKHLLR
jgi:lycopene beta-cyclase